MIGTAAALSVLNCTEPNCTEPDCTDMTRTESEAP